MFFFYFIAIFSYISQEKKTHTLFTPVVVLASSLAVTLGASLGLECLDTVQGHTLRPERQRQRHQCEQTCHQTHKAKAARGAFGM